MEINGEIVKDFPVTRMLKDAKPIYTTLPGWKCDIRGITDESKLPREALAYVDFVEQELGVPVTLFSTGPKRHEIIHRAPKIALD